MKPAEIDRLKSPKALKLRERMCNICLALPETDESTQFGSPVWRVGKKSFAMLYDYGKGLTVQFWVGIERQGPLEMDPRFPFRRTWGHNGWIALDASKGMNDESCAISSSRATGISRRAARSRCCSVALPGARKISRTGRVRTG